MRETIQRRLAETKQDRATIVQFLQWLAIRHGPVCCLLASQTPQHVDLDAELDEFHDIDRVRLEEENKRNGPPPTQRVI